MKWFHAAVSDKKYKVWTRDADADTDADAGRIPLA